MVWVGAGALVGDQQESPGSVAGGSSLVPRQVDLGPPLSPAHKARAVAPTTGSSAGAGGSGPTVFAPVARRTAGGGATSTTTPPLPAPGQGSTPGIGGPTLVGHVAGGQLPQVSALGEQPSGGGATGLGIEGAHPAAEPGQTTDEPRAKPGKTGHHGREATDPESPRAEGALHKAVQRIRRVIAAAERKLDRAASHGATAKHGKAASGDGHTTHHYTGKHRKG
jgi:hypothetical protein